MRALFKNKVSKFGSLISLIALSGMLMIFFAALPQFLASTPGKVFAVVWGLMAASAFVFHFSRLRVRREVPQAVMAVNTGAGKDARTKKIVRLRRAEG